MASKKSKQKKPADRLQSAGLNYMAVLVNIGTGRARHSVRAVVCPAKFGAHGVTVVPGYDCKDLIPPVCPRINLATSAWANTTSGSRCNASS